LHAATAAATCGFDEPPELAPPELVEVVELPPDVLVVELPDELVLAGVDVDAPPPEDEELLLLPHPATTAPLITTTDNNALSLLAIAMLLFELTRTAVIAAHPHPRRRSPASSWGGANVPRFSAHAVSNWCRFGPTGVREERIT
jgi:hypothetical protein